MPVLGVVLTLSGTAPDLIDRISGVDGVSLVGVRHGPRLPVVLETLQKRDDEAIFDRLTAVDGVLHIDLVFADFSDLGLTPAKERDP